MRRFVPRIEVLEGREVPALFTVSTLVDENNGIGSGAVSLREAIAEANAQPGDDTIQFGVAGTINLTGALPDLTSNINITGPGADQLTVHRDTGGNYAIFAIGGGATVGISGMTITGGSATNGGGIANGGTLVLTGSTVSGNSGMFGGGIRNTGTMAVTNSTFSGNSASVQGGGIFNTGTATVTGSTFNGNTAANFGGGILNGSTVDSGTLIAINCTVSGNSASLDGGGIYNGLDDTLTVINTTITGNSATRQGGGLFNFSGPAVLNNTIVAGNTTGANIGGLIDAANSFNNLIGTGNAGGLTTGPNGNMIGVDVAQVLNPTLADNGGPTKTHALLANSPAINAGSNARVPLGVTTDQHGFVRISGTAVDIGAFESSQNQAPALSLPGAQATFEDVAVAISGISFGEPDGTTKTVTLRANHGTLTLPSVTGLTVTGNGKRVLTLSGSIANLNAAMVGLVYRGALNFGGTDSLLVTVSNGTISTSGRVSITVKSSARQAADLRAQVTALRTAGVLTPQQAYSLNVNLILGGTIADVGKVKTFLNRVQAFLQSAVLTQAQADALLGPGNILYLSVKKR